MRIAGKALLISRSDYVTQQLTKTVTVVTLLAAAVVARPHTAVLPTGDLFFDNSTENKQQKYPTFVSDNGICSGCGIKVKFI